MGWNWLRKPDNTDLLHLSEDDSALAFNLLLAEGGVGENVGKDLHRVLQILGQALGVEHSLLPKSYYLLKDKYTCNLHTILVPLWKKKKKKVIEKKKNHDWKSIRFQPWLDKTWENIFFNIVIFFYLIVP